MTKTALETPSNPLRVLNNEDIHEMIGTFPTSLPKLAEELVRRFIKTTHISHHEGDEIAGHDPVTLGVLEGKHTTFLLDRILHDLLQRQHLFLDQCADANINPGGRFLPSGIYELIVRAFAPSGHSDFLGGQETHCLRRMVESVPHGVVLDLL